MPMGPGKYDKQLNEALISCKAKQGILIVVDGYQGQSFSCRLTSENSKLIPRALRMIADEIEKSLIEESN